MRIIAICAVVAILAGCAASTGPKYLNKDGNAATWGEGKREINSSLTQTSSKW
ncbi:MAG TPA: hypothetical protein VN036_00515 [Devosia sp.]|nr:hypothetical protein [Devosia sp.]